MKVFFSLFAVASLILSYIISYNIVVKVIPQYLTMWWISLLFIVIYVVGTALADD